MKIIISRLVKSSQGSSVIAQGRFARDILPFSPSLGSDGIKQVPICYRGQRMCLQGGVRISAGFMFWQKVVRTTTAQISNHIFVYVKPRVNHFCAHLLPFTLYRFP